MFNGRIPSKTFLSTKELSFCFLFILSHIYLTSVLLLYYLIIKVKSYWCPEPWASDYNYVHWGGFVGSVSFEIYVSEKTTWEVRKGVSMIRTEGTWETGKDLSQIKTESIHCRLKVLILDPGCVKYSKFEPIVKD